MPRMRPSALPNRGRFGNAYRFWTPRSLRRPATSCHHVSHYAATPPTRPTSPQSFCHAVSSRATPPRRRFSCCATSCRPVSHYAASPPLRHLSKLSSLRSDHQGRSQCCLPTAALCLDWQVAVVYPHRFRERWIAPPSNDDKAALSLITGLFCRSQNAPDQEQAPRQS